MTASTSIMAKNIYPLAGNALANGPLTKHKRTPYRKIVFNNPRLISKEIKRKDCARVFQMIPSLSRLFVLLFV